MCEEKNVAFDMRSWCAEAAIEIAMQNQNDALWDNRNDVS